MKALLLDLDGVLYQGERAIGGAHSSTAFFEAALARLGHPAAAVCMVGDDISTDVGAAQALGLTGALVKTGKFRSTDLDGDIHPDAVLDSIAALPDWWARRRD